MKRLLVTLTRLLAIPLFALTLALALRSAFTLSSDIFYFGSSNRWVCYAAINFLDPYVEFNSLQSDPAPGGPPKSFFQHTTAKGLIWSFYAANLPPVFIAHDHVLLGNTETFLAGRLIERQHWFHLPALPPFLLLTSSALLLHWRRHPRTKTAPSPQPRTSSP
jgi:hypothetical protein